MLSPPCRGVATLYTTPLVTVRAISHNDKCRRWQSIGIIGREGSVPWTPGRD